MEKNPDARYQTARELSNDIKRYQRDVPVNARHIGTTGRFIRRCRRRPAATAAWTTIGALAIVTTLAMFLIFGKTTQRAIPEWQVAMETYPGSVKTWWFNDDEIAWNMLPTQRTKLGEEDRDFQLLYGAANVPGFIGNLVKSRQDLPKFEHWKKQTTSWLLSLRQMRTEG